MPTYRLDLAYVGTAFRGYARQPGQTTVQGVLEEALFHHTGRVETYVAGRTDKGVHAEGQVVSFGVEEPLDAARVTKSLNKQLGPDIAIKGLAQVGDGFHARFSATRRRYRYLVLARRIPDPFLATTSWHYGRSLDTTAMNDAAASFMGERDFASLCRRSGDASTTRHVLVAEWASRGDGFLEFRVEATSFCHQMVRSMVAICVDVGSGRLEASQIAVILAARDRNAGRGASPPHGLTLVSVDYSD